jgi:hypothetical protein
VAQLSLANGHRPIKIRLRADGSRVFVVRSGSKLKVAYSVDPGEDFRCTCPWAESGGSGCSHSISCWVLMRAHHRRPSMVKTRQCDGCSRHVDRRDLLDVPEGNMVFFESERICRACAVYHGVL